MSLLLLIAVLLLAASNGANDNFKGVATLYGSGAASYRISLAWASVTTSAGALCSLLMAQALLSAFTGKGLVPAVIAGELRFALAIAGGAGVTVALAAWRGLPISTTHALVGAMSGAGLIAVGSGVQFHTLGATFLLPLLLSPLLALIPAYVLAPVFRRLAAHADAVSAGCACLDDRKQLASEVTASRSSAIGMGNLRIDSEAQCVCDDALPLLRIDARRVTDALHFLLAGAVGFARGLNDTPKIAALLLPLATLDTRAAVISVALAMLAGGVFGARRVARTMSTRITRLDLGPAMAASLTTSLLVSTASFNGLPVSTTHVSVGALTGAGAAGQGVNRQVLAGIVLAWGVTLPIGAVFAAMIFWLAS